MNNTPPEVIEKWQQEFIAWMQREHLVKITFDGDSIVVPPISGLRSGRSVPLVAGVAWKAWIEARQSCSCGSASPVTIRETDAAGILTRPTVRVE